MNRRGFTLNGNPILTKEEEEEIISKVSIYKFGLSVCLFVCLFVCLYPINVKTAEPINPRIIFVLFYDVHKENMFRTN